MRIALINLEESFGCLPIGLVYIASYVRKYGGFNDIKIIDREDPLKAIQRYNPDIVGIGVVSQRYYKANKLAGEIKKIIKAPIIIGGIHITAMPHQLKTSNFDIGVVGEGESTFLELLNCFKDKGNPETKDLRKIKGLVFLDKNKKLIFTGCRNLIANLDTIPFPALDLLKMKEFYLVPGPVDAGLIGIRGYLMTSRGCPYNCVYCGSNTIWGRKGTRWHSAERVASDIKRWVETYEVNHFAVYDDLMIVNKPRLRKLVELLEKEDLTKKIDFELYGRANIMDEELCVLLKRMNVTSISFGLESGSEKILKYLKKGTATVDQGKKAAILCKKYGLRISGLFMLGNPGETEEDIKKTIKFATDPVFSSIQVYQTTPFPGTELWQTAINQGIIKTDFYESSERDKQPSELDVNKILTKEMPKERFIMWFNALKKEMERKNYIESKITFHINMLRFFFSYRFYLKLWKRRGHLPNYVKQILRI